MTACCWICARAPRLTRRWRWAWRRATRRAASRRTACLVTAAACAHSTVGERVAPSAPRRGEIDRVCRAGAARLGDADQVAVADLRRERDPVDGVLHAGRVAEAEREAAH